MKREEAQFILGAYRADGATGEEFAEPLQMAANDPELGKWLAREQEMDRLISEKLSGVAVPSGLRDRILAGGRVSRKPTWFRRPAWMALAAAVMVFAGLGGYFMRPVSGRNLPEFAMNYANQGIWLEKEDTDLTRLKTWLAAKNMPTPSVPVKLAALEKLGCRTIHYQGRDVSVICFEEKGREYHLFAARRLPGDRLLVDASRKIVSSGAWSSITWSDAEHDYVLASKGDVESIQRLL